MHCDGVQENKAVKLVFSRQIPFRGHPFGDVFEYLHISSAVIVEARGVDQDDLAAVQLELDLLRVLRAYKYPVVRWLALLVMVLLDGGKEERSDQLTWIYAVPNLKCLVAGYCPCKGRLASACHSEQGDQRTAVAVPV